jgi:GntR family transcriptional regulator
MAAFAARGARFLGNIVMHELFASMRLDKNVPVPLYYQLKRQLLALIESGAAKEGDVLPPENELCNLLHVSRPTIRQAFGEMVAEGYLDRFKGKGTFVSRPKIDDRFFNKLETFQDEMTAKGFRPRTKTLVLERRRLPHEATERLGLQMDEALIYLCRLRFIDNVPLVHVETFLPYKAYERLMQVDFDTTSLYKSLEELYGVRINHAHREIEAVNASRKEAELLQIAHNKALSLVKTTAYADHGPVEFSIARYRGDLNKFSVDVRR